MITIKLEPQPFQPVYNELILVLDSTKKTEESFLFIVDVNIDGVFSSRLKISPNLDGYGVVDLHRHIEPYISFNLDHDETKTFQTMVDSFTKYDVTLSEQYINDMTASANDNAGSVRWSSPNHGLDVGDRIRISNSTVPAYDGIHTVTSVVNTNQFDTSITYTSNAIADVVKADGSTTIYPSTSVMSGDKFAVNSALPFLDVSGFDYEDFVLEPTTPGRFLSTIPTTNKLVNIHDRIWSNHYNELSELMTASWLKVVSDRGEFRIQNPYNTSTDITKFLTTGIGPWNILNTSDSVTTVSGLLPMISENTASYTVQMLDMTLAPTSEEITFVLDKPCTRFENFRMVYLDRFGSFLSVNFDLANKKKVKVKRKTYQKNFGSYNPTTNTYGWNSYDRGRTHLDADISESFSIQTNYVNEDIGQQVLDLIQSPEVYHLTDGISKFEEHNISAVGGYTNTVGFATFKTDVPHNFTVGSEVDIDGITATANGPQIVKEIISPTEFITEKPYDFSYSPSGESAPSVKGSTFVGGGELRAVNIKTSKLEEKQRATDKLINYKLEFEYAFKNVVQRG